jgi:hypothetical protein
MRRSTVVFVLLFLAMAGAYYYLKNREQPTDTADIAVTLEPQAETAYLFNPEDGVPNSIRLEAQTGEVVELARNADAENAWVVKRPFEAAADQGSSEAAASQVTTISITNSVPNVDPKDVGLDVPQYKLVVQFSNGVERIAQIGVLTPTETGYYALKDGEIVIVNRSGIDALITLLTNPPYAETLTPSPIPPTVTDTPLPSLTPEPGTPAGETATPTP